MLTGLIIDGISSHSTHLESYVVLYAAFVAGLYRMIGIEFGEHFLPQIRVEFYILEAISGVLGSICGFCLREAYGTRSTG